MFERMRGWVKGFLNNVKKKLHFSLMMASLSKRLTQKFKASIQTKEIQLGNMHIVFEKNFYLGFWQAQSPGLKSVLPPPPPPLPPPNPPLPPPLPPNPPPKPPPRPPKPPRPPCSSFFSCGFASCTSMTAPPENAGDAKIRKSYNFTLYQASGYSKIQSLPARWNARCSG